MTPLVSQTAGTDLVIENVTFRNVSRNESSTVMEPLDTFLNWTTLPTLAGGDSIEVSVEATNGDGSGTTVLTRYRVGFRPGNNFAPLFDNGEAPDVAAGDNIYTGGYVLARVPGMRHSAVEVIDNTLLTQPDAEYNALLWSMPYLVRMHHSGR